MLSISTILRSNKHITIECIFSIPNSIFTVDSVTILSLIHQSVYFQTHKMSEIQGFRRPARQISNLINTQDQNDAKEALEKHHEYLAKKQNFRNRSFDLRRSIQVYGFNWSINGQIYADFRINSISGSIPASK